MFALTLASCSNDENAASEVEAQAANLTITLSGKSTTSRSVGALPTSTTDPTTGEGKVDRIAVGVFDANGKVIIINEPTIATTSSNLTATVTATTAATDVIVVANATSGYFTGITTKTDFLAKAAELSWTSSSTSTVDSQDQSLPMVGENSSITATSGTETNAVSVSLSRLVARISISSITTSFTGTAYVNSSFKPKEIFLYNAIAEKYFSGSDLSPVTYYSGESTATTSPTLAAYLGTGDVTAGIVISDPYYYYTFANTTTTPTKLVIKGTFTDASGAATTVYYPIIINHAQTGTTTSGGTAYTPPDGTDSKITANTAYKLSAIIKTIGVSSPSADIGPAALALTVTVSDWANTLTQDVIFN